MNWNQLIQWAQSLTPEQRETDVTVFDSNRDETYKVHTADINADSDVLDENHPLLIF